MPHLKSSLLVADLHLSSNTEDAYRWKIWDFLRDVVRNERLGDVFILGDLTQEKDFHSAYLVNGIVDGINNITHLPHGPRVHILAGNHDGIDPATPYFRFLYYMEDVFFYTEPGFMEPESPIFMLPHFREIPPLEDYRRYKTLNFVFGHFTVDGVSSDSGGCVIKSGFTVDQLPFENVEEYFCGDVHAPQRIGPVTYVGAPYHIRYGDNYKPRVLVFNDRGERFSYNTTFPRKHGLKLSLTTGDDYTDKFFKDVQSGDFVKVEVEIQPEGLSNHNTLKEVITKAVENRRANLRSIQFVVANIVPERKRERFDDDDPRNIPWKSLDALRHYCKKRELGPEMTKLAEQLLGFAEN